MIQLSWKFFMKTRTVIKKKKKNTEFYFAKHPQTFYGTRCFRGPRWVWRVGIRDASVCRNARGVFGFGGITLAARNAEEIMRRKRTSPLKSGKSVWTWKRLSGKGSPLSDGRCLRDNRNRGKPRRNVGVIAQRYVRAVVKWVVSALCPATVCSEAESRGF